MLVCCLCAYVSVYVYMYAHVCYPGLVCVYKHLDWYVFSLSLCLRVFPYFCVCLHVFPYVCHSLCASSLPSGVYPTQKSSSTCLMLSRPPSHLSAQLSLCVPRKLISPQATHTPRREGVISLLLCLGVCLHCHPHMPSVVTIHTGNPSFCGGSFVWARLGVKTRTKWGGGFA